MSDEHPVGESPVEKIKRESRYLRGDIGVELSDGQPEFGKASVQLLKHHGTYQQDDRDARGAAREAGQSGKSYMMMVRTRLPGGRLSSDQLLAELDLADALGNQTLRVTTRQGLQLHGILKGDLRSVIRRIHESRLTTLGACGDVNRNVMCCPAPYETPFYRQIQALADELAEHFAPRTSAYRELWLDDGEERTLATRTEHDVIEPLYGDQYLPRKFKMAVGLPHDNCVDLYTHDLGLMAVIRDDELVGYNVLVGGGQGVTPSNKKTFPALARKLAFVAPDRVIATARAIVEVQRDHGNRADRKTARLKYLIHRWGMPKFKSAVEEAYGDQLAEPEHDDIFGFDDHIGWGRQSDEQWFYGLNIENGRIADNGVRLKSALRAICGEFRPGIHLTSHQGMVLSGIAAEQREPLTAILREYNVPLSEDISNARRWSMACVAWPTCGLAITESERALPSIIDEIEKVIARWGLEREKFTIRMTGCPNGCARPYNSDIGLVGKARNKYTLLVGGRLLGNRLNFIYRDLVPSDEVAKTLEPLFAYFKNDRQPDETFGDFCHRKGREDLDLVADEFVG